MKAIIIDDEVRGCNTLQKMLHHVAPAIQVCGMAHNGEDGLALIDAARPDLVFLDIEMPDMTGFDVLQRTGVVNFDVIFTTAYSEFALKAFRFAAVDYLLKPIDIDELQQAVEKCRKTTAVAQKNEPQIDTLLQQIRNNDTRKLVLPSAEGMVFVDVDDIIYLQASSNYTTFFTASKGKILVSKSMGDFEEILTANNFFRIHNSNLINLAKIEKFIKGDGGTVIMSNKMELEVSRRKKEEFIKKLETLGWRLS
jgi:two-component system LytT family response regulator